MDVCVLVNLERHVCAFTSERTPLAAREEEGTWLAVFMSYMGTECGCC